MSSDYKYDMQLIAEELAQDEYGQDFYELSNEIQYQLYSRAMRNWSEQRIEQADFARDAARER